MCELLCIFIYLQLYLILYIILEEQILREDTMDFIAEINMLKEIGYHKNIVHLLGYVTKDHPYLMIMELIRTGNLRSYLHKLREIWQSGIKDKNNE